MKDHEKAQLVNELNKEVKVACGTATPNQLRSLISRVVGRHIETDNLRQLKVDWRLFKDEQPEDYGTYLTYWADGTIETFSFDEYDMGKESIVLNGIPLTHWAKNVSPPYIEPEV